MAGLAFLTSLALFSMPLLMGKIRLAYYGLLGLLGWIAFLTITDEFGVADLVVLILTLTPLLLLIKDRGWYFQTDGKTPELNEQTSDGSSS
jgi:hypothetical protein